MGRRSYSGEKRRKELARKAKKDAKVQERKQQARGEGEVGGGPPIDWDAQVGGLPQPPEPEEEREEGAGQP